MLTKPSSSDLLTGLADAFLYAERVVARAEVVYFAALRKTAPTFVATREPFVRYAEEEVGP